MARAYSMDLRERVVQAVEQEGLSRRKAADRFGIGIKTAIDWVVRFRETGSVAAKPMGGCRPKKIVGEHRGARTIDALWRAIGDICSLYAEQECWNYLKDAGYAPD